MALLSDIKIEEETKNTFDKIFDYYYPDVECLQNYKTMVHETIFDDLLCDPYEILYYFMIMPITRYVNNYGIYKNSVFENNMERQMKKIQRVFTHNGINMVRKELGEINNLIQEYNVNVYDMKSHELLKYHVEYRWRCKFGSCKYCESLENKPLQKINYSKVHYNCKCNIVKIEWYENNKGQKLKYLQKIIT